jgi:aspartate/methionine/tyrosine aminotransferase
MKTTKRVQNLQYAIRDVVIPAQKLEATGVKVLHLNIGDPVKFDLRVPDFAVDAMARAVKEGKNFYANSAGAKEARQAVVEREKRINGLDFGEGQVLTTNGVSEAISFLCGALVDSGDEVLVPSPAYPLYLSFPPYFGGKAVQYSCDEQDEWNPDVQDLESKITDKTRAIAVINPNNPTGAVYSKKTLKQLVELAGQHDLVLISDEIYDEIIYPPYGYDSLSSVAVREGVPVVQMNGLSKNFLATGWRAGYMVFHNCDELLQACSKQSRTRLCACTPSQYAMAECLNGPRDFLKEVMGKMDVRRKIVVNRCKEIGLECVEPKGAFYAFPRIGEGVDDKKWVLDLLQEQHVLTVFGSGFGEAGKGHFRIVYLPPPDVLEKAFDGIAEFVKNR